MLFLLFNPDFGKLVPETNEREGKKNYFFVFLFGSALIVGGCRLVGLGRKSHSRNVNAGLVQSLPLFSNFWKPSPIKEVMEETYEVNANAGIEDMDLCDFTQDTSPTPAPTKNHRLHPPY